MADDNNAGKTAEAIASPNKSTTDLSEAAADVFAGRKPAASERQWAEQTLSPALERAPEKPIGASTGTNLDERGRRSLHHDFRRAGTAALHARRSARGLELRAIPGLPGPAALHPRNSCHRLPRQAVDDASVLRLCLSGRDQPALQVPAGARQRRAFGGLRPADADGLRQRSCVQRGRGRQVRRGHRFARGHGDTVQRNRSGKDDGFDDHQLSGFDSVGHVPGGRRKTGRGLEEDFPAPSRTTS